MNKNSRHSFRAVLKGAASAVGRGFHYLWIRSKHNFGLKLLSLIFSIILCNLIMTQSNPVRRTQVNDVPVVFAGQSTLESNKLTLSAESRANRQLISVTLGVRMQEMSRVGIDSVTARVDLASITEPGEYDLPIQVTSELGTVYSRSPQRLKVTVERLRTKAVKVEFTPTGELQEHYVLSSTTLSPEVISVTGPESLVDQVYRAVVEMDVSEMTESSTGSQSFVLMDEDGNVLDASGLDLSASGVIVTANVKRSTSLPVNAALSLIHVDQLAEGHTLTGITVRPDTVSVTGSDTALTGVVELTCDVIDLTGLSENTTFRVKIKPIAGLTLETDEVEVVVSVDTQVVTQTFVDVPVQVLNLDSSLTVANVNPVTVTVTGPENVVSQLTSESFTVTADAKGLRTGAYPIKVRVALDAAYQEKIGADGLSAYPGQVVLTLEPVE